MWKKNQVNAGSKLWAPTYGLVWWASFVSMDLDKLQIFNRPSCWSQAKRRMARQKMEAPTCQSVAAMWPNRVFIGWNQPSWNMTLLPLVYLFVNDAERVSLSGKLLVYLLSILEMLTGQCGVAAYKIWKWKLQPCSWSHSPVPALHSCANGDSIPITLKYGDWVLAPYHLQV